MTATTTPLLDAALASAARGWHVFPCHTPTANGCSCRRDCGRIGKHPRTKNGLKDATTDATQIRRWWKMWPAANVGIVTGAVSGLVVLDNDSYKGGDASLHDLEQSYAPLPETVLSLTGGGGVQYVFQHPGTPIKNGVETLGVGLDIRGDGGYVIAPPSLHASGTRYIWEVVHEPDDMPLAPMPDWLCALCQETARRETVDAGASIPDGQRGEALFKLGCSMRGRGFSHAAILGALQAINATQCQPPVEDRRLEAIAARCATYEAGAIPPHLHQHRNGPTAPTDAPTTEPQDTRPVIRIGPDITRLVDAGQAALLALAPGPVLFQRARRLTIIARGIKPPRWLHRPADAPVMVEAQAAYLDELATKAARWEKFDKRAKKGEEWIEITPPSRFVQTLQARPSWPFPLLEGIIHSPTLRPDGSLLDTPGYDVSTGLFFDSNGTTFPTLPTHVTLDVARSSIGRLQEVVKDFPFAHPWHFSAWLSAILSGVCRFTIQGCVPMHGITATTRGSGKTLLADTIATITTNHPAARWSQVFDEDEERKRLLALALDGDPLICIDNVTAPLGSGVLALALTGSSFKDRLLGVNQTKEAPLSAVFLCTGNNIQYVGDVARRVVPIAIDPVMERPEERTDFTHPNLLAWVKKERPRLTIAALTIVKAYFDAGRPAQGLTPFGSFEAWSDLIRQALVWAGEDDPCEGRKDIEATSNPEFETLAALLHAWHACYGTEAVTLAQIEEDCARKMQHIGPESTANEWNTLHAALGACDTRFDGKQLNARRIGNALRGWQGRVIDGKRLVTLPIKATGGKALWKLDVLTSV